MLRRVTKYGEAVLKQNAEAVSDFGIGLNNLAADLIETLAVENGLGLAAPQIGVSKRVFAIDMRRRSDTDTPCRFKIDGREIPLDIAMPLVAVNPEVEEIGDYVEICDEGCLSFPGIFAEVERSAAVRMIYSDLSNARHELVCEGLFARCVQHENDHLNGITFIDHLKAKELFKIQTKLRKLRKQTKEFLKGSQHKGFE